MRAIQELGQRASPKIHHEIASDQIRWGLTEVNITNNEVSVVEKTGRGFRCKQRDKIRPMAIT